MVNAGKVKAKVTHNEVNGGIEGLLKRLGGMEKRALYVDQLYKVKPILK